MDIDDGFGLGGVHAIRGDDTPEEKLKYARMQTEGYQDDGYQDSAYVSIVKCLKMRHFFFNIFIHVFLSIRHQHSKTAKRPTTNTRMRKSRQKICVMLSTMFTMTMMMKMI